MQRLFTLLLFAALAAPALAQSSSKGVVGVDAAGPSGAVAPGSNFTATVNLAIRPGYHVNAEKPTEDYLIGTLVTVSPPAGLTVVKTAYPPAEYATFSFSETPLAVYEGTAKVTVTMKVDAGAAPGTVSVPAKVRFQACNDQQCLPPATVDVSFDVEVSAAAAGGKQTLTLAGMPPDARVTIDGRAAGRANAQGRFVARDVEVGRRRVRVEMDGFEPWEQTVDLAAERPQTLTVALVSAPAGEPAAEPAPGAETPAAAPGAATPPAATPSATPAEEPGDDSNTTLYVVGGIAVLALAGIGIFAVTRR